jgi:hypothetical protein
MGSAAILSIQHCAAGAATWQFGTLAPNLWAMSIASTHRIAALLPYLNATGLHAMN